MQSHIPVRRECEHEAGENLFLVTPSGMIYEEMTADDVVVIDRDCRVVEGTRKPSSDSPALVYMFEHMPHINALIHTHQLMHCCRIRVGSDPGIPGHSY